MIVVAHVVLGLRVGGLERMVVELLAKLDRSRFAPTVCALEELGPLADELRALRIPVHAIPRRERGIDVLLAPRLGRWLANERTAIVHTHNPAPHLYGALAARTAGLPRPRLVHTKHGRNVPHTWSSVLLNRAASALSDRIVTVSDDARAVALDVERVDPAKVLTIKNGVDTRAYRPRDDGGRARDRARAALGLPESSYHLVSVARLSPEKDHATLIEAFARLRDRLPDAHLTLVGDGPERRDLERRAAAQAPGAVTFAGMRTDVADLLPAFDAFALASRTEGISLTLLEAAAAGLPIVATAVGGNPEVVQGGVTGLLVPPADPGALATALEALAGRPDRAEMGLSGRRRVEAHFGATAMVQAYSALYEDVLARGRASPPRERGTRKAGSVGSSRVDLQACKLEYSIVSPK